MGKIWGDLGTLNEAGKNLGPPGESGEILGDLGKILGDFGTPRGELGDDFGGLRGDFPPTCRPCSDLQAKRNSGVLSRHDMTSPCRGGRGGSGRGGRGGSASLRGRGGFGPGSRGLRPERRRVCIGAHPLRRLRHRGVTGGSPGPPLEIRDPPPKNRDRPQNRDPPAPQTPGTPRAPGAAQGGSRCSPRSPRVGPGRTRHRDRADVTATSLPPEVVTGRGNGGEGVPV